MLTLRGSQPVSLPIECEQALTNTRFRVDFDQTKEDVRVFGHTLTNPGEAYININWIKDLELQLILTKTEEGSYRVYVDSKNNSIIPVNLTLRIDPSILERKWYEKVNFTISPAFGNSLIGANSFGGLLGIGAGYLVRDNINLGINVSAVYAGNLYLFYGASLTWWPFMRK